MESTSESILWADGVETVLVSNSTPAFDIGNNRYPFHQRQEDLVLGKEPLYSVSVMNNEFDRYTFDGILLIAVYMSGSEVYLTGSDNIR